MPLDEEGFTGTHQPVDHALEGAPADALKLRQERVSILPLIVPPRTCRPSQAIF